jgi:hypothetical protein
MLGLFKRTQPGFEAGDLGRGLVALPLRTGCIPPAGCAVVVVGAGGHTRRGAPGKKIELRDGELAWTYHPGPYTVDLAPFAQAAEIGLRTSFAIDLDAGGERHRFDLLLAAEAQGPLHLATLTRALEEALQRALAQGALELPPCTTIDEWNAFRQGLNQLCWMRFGLTVDDCVPVDLGETRDFAGVLAARAAQASAEAQADTPVRIEPQLGETKATLAAGAEAGDIPADDAPAVPDARALRRLFLELPGLMCGLRMAALPSNQDQFRRQQVLLQRLDLLSVAASTMPALDLAAPGQPLAASEQQRRARHSRRACVSLDEAWALLGRFNALGGAGGQSGQRAQPGADALARLYDEAERIVANLELDAGARRGVEALADEAEGEGA